ncbi:MAG: fibrobacter succinogenes major paralogous domain-containing protein [Bacteroidales bacterium]|nr:fibrobacter succinogenes major paralogous domain-containing protein [Bacteroidales bacterium]
MNGRNNKTDRPPANPLLLVVKSWRPVTYFVIKFQNVFIRPIPAFGFMVLFHHGMTEMRKPGFIALILVIYLAGCTKEESDTVTDIDGNVYHTVKIGDQVWMAENLKVTGYRNGDSIPVVEGSQEWDELHSGAYCNMNNEGLTAAAFGHLYNWYAVSDKRGLCPPGWHVPSDNDWDVLIGYLGGEEVAGGKLKSTDSSFWKPPNTGAVDLVGFAGLPGGTRWDKGLFLYFGYYGLWWSSTAEDADFAWYRNLIYDNPACFRNHFRKNFGCSVRCIKD